MGRPKKEIDPVVVEKLARLQCTPQEIAAFVDCSPDTIRRRFAAQLAKGAERGRRSIRRQQFKLLREGNVTMAIWLGKQYLGQADKTEISGKDLDAAIERELARLAAAGKAATAGDAPPDGTAQG